jgi:hypothetical protein
VTSFPRDQQCLELGFLSLKTSLRYEKRPVITQMMLVNQKTRLESIQNGVEKQSY